MNIPPGDIMEIDKHQKTEIKLCIGRSLE